MGTSLQSVPSVVGVGGKSAVAVDFPAFCLLSFSPSQCVAVRALLLALPFRSGCDCVLGAHNHQTMDVIKAIKFAPDSSLMEQIDTSFHWISSSTPRPEPINHTQ